MNPFDRIFFDTFGLRVGSDAMSPAGRMLDRMEGADKRVESEGITDELRCAMRRAEIKAMREVQP